MTAAPTVSGSRNGTPVSKRPVDRKAELERTLSAKLAQGYAIESQGEDRAILVVKGRSRWFGLANGPSVRFELTVDERGRTKSRRL